MQKRHFRAHAIVLRLYFSSHFEASLLKRKHFHIIVLKRPVSSAPHLVVDLLTFSSLGDNSEEPDAKP